MDAVKFIREHERMCKAQSSCEHCPASGNCIKQSCFPRCPSNIRSEVKLVEQWAAEHPLMTRWTKLKKEYPTLNDSERKQLCVCAFGYKCDCDLNCAKHWDMPVDEEKEKE